MAEKHSDLWSLDKSRHLQNSVEMLLLRGMMCEQPKIKELQETSFLFRGVKIPPKLMFDCVVVFLNSEYVIC